MNFETSHKVENAENTVEKGEGRNHIESDLSLIHILCGSMLIKIVKNQEKPLMSREPLK